MSEKYLKVEINGKEENLPKTKGVYMICNRQSFYMQTRFNPKLKESIRVWLKEVIWYEFPLPDAEITEEMIEKRFPINVSMIRPCNLSTRNKWIWQGIKWYQRNHNRPNLPEIPNDEIQEA